MLLGGGGVEKVLGPHLHRVHRAKQIQGVRSAEIRDVISISAEARLVQKAREAASGLPEIRQDLVERAAARLKSGREVSAQELADIIAGRARRRQV